MDITSLDKKTLAQEERRVSEHLRRILPKVQEKVEEINPNKFSSQSLHAQIGSKNNNYVDSVRTNFVTPDDFIAQWLLGLLSSANSRIEEGSFSTGILDAGYYLIQYLKVTEVRDYIFTFLKRNFYRNFKERVRIKSDESLWSLWFGGGNLVWGLVIEPVFRHGIWTNDKSEMRRADYNYWTIGHVLSTGFIDPSSEVPFEFQDCEDFLRFYQSVITRTSNSQYDKAIAMRYIEYIKASGNVMQEPLLLPELRYAGRESKHLYRLDYTVLNPYVMKMTGFEISPASTHLSIRGAKGKTQQSINAELSEKWAKESRKRNSYFKTYGISTITFTDTDLIDIDSCFTTIESCMKERATPAASLKNTIVEFDLFIQKNNL